MASQQYLRTLFKAHQSDLKSVFPDIRDDIFICPICFRDFREEDIENKNLTDGHVWPKYFRAQSEGTKEQRVLLCKRCNSTTGSRGDAQIQLNELVKEGDDKGIPYGKRVVQLFKIPSENLVKVTTFVQKHGDGFILTDKLYDSDPKELEKLETLVGDKGPIFLEVNNHPSLKPELVKVGLITSAYLYAFYSLGYRYIFNQNIFPVREFIQNSLNDQIIRNSETLELNEFKIRSYSNKFFNNPEIMIVVPVDNKTFVHLEINFKKYNISLPMFYVKSVLSELIHYEIPDFDKKILELKESDRFIYIPILNSKHERINCTFDYLMGKQFAE